MNKAVLSLIIVLALAVPAMAEEYAIIKDSMFGSQKIEFYSSREEALRHFSGEGKLYKITRTEVQVKRIMNRKKVEVTEYNWVIDDTRPAENKAVKKPAPATK